MEFNWPPLESNPEIFTNYMHRLGMKNAHAIGEVFGFDEELLAFLPQPILGVIVAVQRLKKEEDKENGSEENCSKVHYYMKQTDVLDNACGIIACLHSCLNNLDPVELNEGSILSNFYNDVKTKTPAERADALASNAEWQALHKEFAVQGQSAQAENQEQVNYHFIAYVVNKDKELIELDGTKKGPHVVATGCEDVLRGSIAEIKKRLEAKDISESLSMMTLNGN